MLNRAILMGRLTADPEYRQTPNGIAVATFTLAVNRNYQPKSGERQSDFINIVAWRHTADFVHKYFAKGQQVAVEGSIQTRNYEDKNGNKRTAFEIVADQVYFAESKQQSTQSYAPNFPVPTDFEEPASGASFSVGDIGDFEEVDADGSELPF
ncbi:MAG: single-stranded DNA-binding protein [Oscillospiraceae bacterium]